jgi:hypothetical protein
MSRPTGGAAPAARQNPFRGTSAVTLPCRGAACAGLDVFAAPAARVARHVDDATGRAVYIAGRAWHPTVSDESLPQWCAQTLDADPSAFRALLGAFVVLIDDRRAKRVTFVSDPLGLLPWFVGASAGGASAGGASAGGTDGGRLVAGTDVLGICDAGLSGGEVDFDSVASWLCYNFVAAGGSVVRDYRRMPGGTVATFERDGRLVSETRYATIRYVRNVVPPEQLIEGLYERVSAAFERLVQGVDEVNLPLSGGYDSRLLAALAAAHGRPKVNLTVVESTPGETLVARRVAEALGLPLRVLPVGARVVDLFDDPLDFIAEGFPVARNLTNAVARLHPGMPVLSGFMGDAIMRAPIKPSVSAFLALDDKGLDDDELARAAHERFLIRTNRLHLLREPVESRALTRGIASLLPVIRQGRDAGRPLAFTNIHLRHRLYFAGIFLSHLDVADALLPFTAWDLIDYHARHNGSFAPDTYDRLFRRYFPALADIPHCSQVKANPGNGAANAAGPPRHLRRWARELLRGMPGKWGRSAIVPRKLLRRLPGALFLRSRHADEIGYLHRIHAFEDRLARASVGLRWPLV